MMSRIARTLALAAAVIAPAVIAPAVIAPAVGAQQPGGRGPGPMPMARGGGPGGRGGAAGAASMLLGQTAELKLSDAQVTRLAAIARRTADRRTANRSAMDSMRAQFRPAAAGTAPRPSGPPAAARALMERMTAQNHEDLRDALAVLTPDQQASAWESMARRSMMARMGSRNRMGGRGRGGFGMRRGGPGMGQGGAPGMRRGGPPGAPSDSTRRTAPRRPADQ